MRVLDLGCSRAAASIWLAWHKSGFLDNEAEIRTLEADRGEYVAYIRVVGCRQGEKKLQDYCWPDTMRSAPQPYTKKPLLRGHNDDS